MCFRHTVMSGNEGNEYLFIIYNGAYSGRTYYGICCSNRRMVILKVEKFF